MKLAIGVAGLLLLVVLFMVSYVGMSTHSKVYEMDMDNLTFIYRSYKGPYSEARKAVHEISYVFTGRYPDEDIKGIGIFYDTPGSVPRNEMKSLIGVMVTGLTEVADEPIDGYSIALYAGGKLAAIDMELKDESSYVFNPVKAYPKLRSYMNRKKYGNGPVLEVYDKEAGKITYAIAVKPLPGILKGYPYE